MRECLELYAGYYAQPRDIDETIELVGLEEKAETLGAQLSGGQRRRLDVALALIGDPELIFLDEPTTGFDPSARRTAWEVIDGLRELGKTVFLTTHYMDEAEHLADRIAVIAGGRSSRRERRARSAAATGSPRRSASRCRRESAPTSCRAELRALARRRRTARVDARRPRRRSSTCGALADWALAPRLDLPDLDVRRPTLEDVYLELTTTGG